MVLGLDVAPTVVALDARPVRERMQAELQRLLSETRYESGLKSVKQSAR